MHEAPELLHYGIDTYTAPAAQGQAPAATKNLRRSAARQTARSRWATAIDPVQIGQAFRTRSPRVLRLTDLAAALAAANNPALPIDSAEMGFAMTEGVGMVSFVAGGRVKAIVPLNVAALRVSNPDSTNVTTTGAFAGRTAAFDLLPHGQHATEASTGDTIWLPLGAGTPSDALGTGIHLHWELPEYFKRGHRTRHRRDHVPARSDPLAGRPLADRLRRRPPAATGRRGRRAGWWRATT